MCMCHMHVQDLEWQDKALFGLARGWHLWQVQRKSKRKLFGLLGKTKTQVTLEPTSKVGGSCAKSYSTRALCAP